MNTTKREDFDVIFKELHPEWDMSKDTAGKYLDIRIEISYRAYVRAYKQAALHFKTLTYPTDLKGPFVVGGVSKEDERLSFARPPFVHKVKESAFAEAQRLADINDCEYWVYAPIGKFTKPKDRDTYRVAGNMDQIDSDQQLIGFTWVVISERLPNRVYCEFDNKEAALEVYEYMRERGMVATRNWLD